jgi:hypothetical protein
MNLVQLLEKIASDGHVEPATEPETVCGFSKDGAVEVSSLDDLFGLRLFVNESAAGINISLAARNGPVQRLLSEPLTRAEAIRFATGILCLASDFEHEFVTEEEK